MKVEDRVGLVVMVDEENIVGMMSVQPLDCFSS